VKTAVENGLRRAGCRWRSRPRAASATARPSPSWTWSLTPAPRVVQHVTPDVAGFILDEVLVRNNFKLDGLLGQFKNGKTPLADIPLIETIPISGNR